MLETITLVECPRDAFQGLPQFIPTETKADYLLALIDAGFSEIDFGSFVSPRAVPQMRDTAQVLDRVRARLGRTQLIAIVPNETGLAAAIGARDIRCAGFSLSVSETFQQRNFRQTLAQAWKMTSDLRKRSHAVGMEFMVYLSMAFGNPYGDAWSAERVISFVEKLSRSDVSKVSLADTVGLASAETVHTLVSTCRLRFPDLELGVHLHARPDGWEPVVMAAYSAGCRRFDGALGGMGGCPFAEDTLVGNIPTEKLIERFSKLRLKLEVTQESVQPALAAAQHISSRYSRGH
ncbi:MAG: hydroxymethylglutaryl-CoA lyase [Acidimicrobiia bacterium]|nr:hydroxymethylglutaryl-CoA lyase [Acidimicrobiia bacterium]